MRTARLIGTRLRRAGPIAMLGVAVALVLDGCQPSPRDAGHEGAEGTGTGSPGSAAAETFRYAGTIPCADCEGIRVELTLRMEMPSMRATTYDLRETYLGTKDGDRVFERSGRWTDLRGSADDPNAPVYLLDPDSADTGRSYLKVGTWALRQLDRSRAAIRSPLNYALVRADLSPVGEPLSVTEGESGRSVKLRIGQELIAQLAANHATGFAWSLADTMGGAIALPDPPTYAEDASSANRVGAGGAETWRFVGIEPGKQTLHFTYRRPSEKNPAAARRALFTVTVE